MVALMLAGAVLLAGALLPGTPLETPPTVGNRNMPILPDCPGRIGDVHFLSGAEHVRDEFVDMHCTYHNGRKLASIRAWYYTPPADAGRIPGPDFCWKVRGKEEDPEHVGPQKNSGQVWSEDHFIWVTYLGHNGFPPKKARKAAVRLMRDLVGEGRVVACPSATSAEEATGPVDELAAARKYLALAEEYDAQRFERPQDDYAALATAADDFVSDLEGLMLPEIAQAQVDALIAASAEQARVWRLIASRLPGEGEEDDVDAILEDFDSIEADVAALSAAADERTRADEALRQVLGLPLSGDDLSEEESPDEEASTQDTVED